MQSFGSANNDNAGAFEFALGNIFKCFLCTRKDNSEDTMKLELIGENLEKLTNKIGLLEKLLLIDAKDSDAAFKKIKIIHGEAAEEIKQKPIHINDIKTPEIRTIEILPEEQQEGFSWVDDEALQRGEVLFLTKKEENFWSALIEKYLHPIDDSQDKVIYKIKYSKTSKQFTFLGAYYKESKRSSR